MKRLTGVLLGLLILFGAFGIAVAQETAEATTPPPKVMVIYREFLKPGRAGTLHEKSESAFVQALSHAKWPTHYFAADSLSGRPRTLFFNGYGSFADWEKDHMMMMKNPALGAMLDRAAVADGDLLSETDQTVATFNEDQSLHAAVDIAHMRGFEISVYRIRPGHRKDWSDLVKLVKEAYEKVPDTHWAMYEVMFGPQVNPTYLVFTPFKSGAEIDHEADRSKDFMAAMGEDGMKRLSELEAATVESTQSNLFVFNPAISYPPDEWINADPDFWKPRASKPMAPKKPAEKAPAGN